MFINLSKMNLKSVIFLFCAFLIAFSFARDCPNVKRINSKLICYYSKTKDVDSCYCTHVVLPANTDVKEIENLRRKLTGVKILLTVNEFNQALVKTVKQNHIDGLELDLKKLSSKEDVSDFINTVRTKFGNDLYLALSIPPKTELLAKYYDLKALTKTTDLFILQTAFLGASKNVTFHPSRLSGLWDMQNTDSVVDLVTGLGAPLSRLAVTAPVQAFQFRLQDSGMTTPGSPALEIKTITRKALCDHMKSEQEQSWTLERDQDQAGPYIFRGTDWIAFEDPTSMDIKAKYTRVRGLAGLALKDLSQDIATPAIGDGTTCSSLLAAAHAGLSKQNRAPRGAVLRSLEREILETPGVGHPLEKVNVSPFRITRVVDVEGHVHSVRKDTRTEFTCTRQGYFVHPQSCGRFYRCVKFDQLTDEFSVFEFDCPAGLAFDERVEVCVWPGSLPHGAPCQGSSEIAPVPRGRFKCPSQPGYYVDPENCRWFFACLDHGQSEMTAYEFRCPFGLVFDEKNLLCQWPWLVPTCANGYITGLELDSIHYFGGAAKSTLIGASGNQHNLNVHLTAGAQILDSYDGLGSLETVALGGYHGDINILKNSLASQNLGLANVHLHQGGEGIGLGLGSGTGYSGNDGEYLTVQHGSNSQNGGYISGYGHGANAQLSINDQTSNLNGGLLLTNTGDGYLNYGGNGQLEGHHGLGIIGSQINLGAGNVQHGLSGSEINLGLLDEGKQQESVLVSSDLNTNFGDKLTSVNYQGNSGQDGITLINSGLQAGQGINKIATSSVEFNNYNQGNQGGVLIDTGSSGYQGGNDKLVLNDASYKLEAPVQQTVLLGSGIKSNNVNVLHGAKSTLSNVQYFGNHGNSEQKTVLLGTDNSHLINTGTKSGSSFQTIQQEIPVHTVQLGEGNYGTLNYGHQYANEAKYIEHPLISQIQGINSQSAYGTKLTHNTGLYGADKSNNFKVLNYATNYYGVTPKTDIFNLKSATYQYQTPAVHYEQKVQPVVLQSGGAKSHSFSQTYHHQSPVVQYEQKVQPIVYEQKVQQPIVYEQKIQPVVLQTQTGGVKSHSHSQTYHHQSPVVQLEQKVQPIVYEQKVHPIVLQTQSGGAKSQSYSQTYHHQSPVVQLEQKVQPIVYEQKVQPVVLQTQSGGAKSHSFSQTYQHQSPVIQYEQKVQPIVYEQKVQQPIVIEQKAEPVVLESQSGGAKSHSFSQTYHHQSPVVQYEQNVQPIVYEQQVQQPIVLEQKAEPVVLQTQSGGAKSHSFSQTYHHQSPVVQYEEKVQPIVYEQKVQQPIVFEQKAEPVVLQTQSGGAKSHSFSQTYHHQSPVVQYEQKVEPIVYEQKVQPIVYEQKVQQPIVIEQKAQPVVLQSQSGGAKSHSFSQTYHHQSEQKVKPIVYEQKVQQPILYEQKVQQPILYEQKVQQPIVFEQKAQPVVLQTQSGGAKSHSFSQTYHHQNEEKIQPVIYGQKVQQPIVYEQKVQQPIVYEQKVQPVALQTQSGGAKSHSFSQTYQHQSPVVQYEQKVQQPIVYEQKVQQPIVYEQKIQPVVYKTESEGVKSQSQSYSSINHYHTPVVQYEQKIEQQNIPLVQQQEVLLHKEVKTPVVPIVGGAKQHSYSSTYHYQTPTVHYEQKVQPEINLYKTDSGESRTQFYGVQQEFKTPVVHQEILLPKVQPIAVTPKYEKIEEIKFASVPAPEIKQTAYSSSYLKHEVPQVQYEQKVQPVVQFEQKVQPIVQYEQKIQPVVYKTVSEDIKSHSYSQTYQHQSPVVQYEQKVQPIIQQNIELKSVQQPEILLHKVETPVTQKYETQYYQNIQLPTVSVTPNYQEINIPVVKQPSAFVAKVNIPTVTVTPKYESHSYSTIKHHITAPKVEAIAVTPKYETQFYAQPIEKIQPITYEGRVPVVEPKVVQKIVQPLYETYSQPAKVHSTYYGKQVDHVQTVTSRPQIVNSYYVSSTPKPQIYLQPKPVSTTPKYSIFQEFIQPKQTFEIKKTIQPITYHSVSPVKTVTAAPTIVESYSYLPPKVEIKQESREYLPPVQSTPRAYLPVKLPEVYVSTTPKYSVFQDFVQPKQTFEIKKTVSPTVISEYQYENPDFAHYESKLNFNSAQDLSYEYQPAQVAVKLPKVQTETVYYSTQKPVVSTVQTIPIKSYQTDYILSTPKPTFVSTIAPIVKQTPTLRTKVVAINKYETLDNKYLVSTPKPIYVSTPAPIITQTDSLGEFKYYDSRFDTGTKKDDFVDSSQYFNNQFDNYEYVDVAPKVKIVTSTVRPVQRKKIVSTTTQIPFDTYQEYYDDKFDSQYIVSSQPTIATTYRPQIRKNYYSTTTESYNDNLGYIITQKPVIRPVQRKKIVSTTTAIPLNIYNNDYVITTSRPIVKKKKIVTTTALPIDYDEYYVSSVKPASVKITPRPKGKTIVRVNDFHPFLTTKLGAQCTCTSNTVKLRKSKQRVEIPEYDFELPDNVPVTKITSSGPASYDDYNEPGVYVVGNSDTSDYDYEPKKIVAVTRTPDVVFKSTTNAIQPAPTPIYTIRKKVTTIRPEVSSISLEPEIILSNTPASAVVDEVFLRKSKEQKIAEAVNEGLSLVKSAIKGYVKDAVQEEVRNFDRYGPGGWRSRDETLQGSVDCKRAGLFRHPTQCNKFYACHWDCTKQRYTLHVFNCPVHLTFDTTQGACNWPSKGPSCTDNTLLPSA